MSAIFSWATSDNLQPEPITVEVWRELPEDFCRQVEVVDGQAIRCESPTRPHQKAARWLANMLQAAAEAHMTRDRDICLDVDSDFDVTLWQLPAATIRRPDAALYDCAPEDLRPLPASHIRLVVEFVSPRTEKTDTSDKMAEYARAGIPWYWLVWVADNQVASINVHVLDHVTTSYRLHQVLEPNGDTTTLDVPIRISIDWARLTELIR